MAGRGPAPKDPERRASHAKDPIEPSALEFVPGEQPELPPPTPWHPQTQRWWKTWGESAQSRFFTAQDWDFLLDTALMHHAMWSRGQWTLAAEVRLRVAKYGATPEDRARLRWRFVDSEPLKAAQASLEDAKEAERKTGGRYSGLRVVND